MQTSKTLLRHNMKEGIHFYEGPYLILHNKTKPAWDKWVSDVREHTFSPSLSPLLKSNPYLFIFKSSLSFALYKSKTQQHKYTHPYSTYELSHLGQLLWILQLTPAIRVVKLFGTVNTRVWSYHPGSKTKEKSKNKDGDKEIEVRWRHFTWGCTDMLLIKVFPHISVPKTCELK